MIKSLSSIKLTFIMLIVITVLMGVGIALTYVDEYSNAIRLMSEMVVLNYFKSYWQNNMVIFIWVLVICIASAILFINTALCSITQQLKTALKIPTLRKWSFFIIHITFLIVLSCHGITMITGEKESGIKLFEGDSYPFKNYNISIPKIEFSDNVQMLKLSPKESRALMTRETFHKNKNYAEISIQKNTENLISGKTFMLKPLKYNSIRLTISRFIYSEQNEKNPVGIELTISENMLTDFFISIYAVMIITLICFIVITWQPQQNTGVANES